MGRTETVARIAASGCVAVVRAKSSDQLVDVAKALREGGIIAIEITMTTPNALEVISKVSRELGSSAVVGVGTVLDAETAGMAIEAGAEFVVSPILTPAVIEAAHEQDKPCICGAFTPTEIFAAWTAGAEVVKVFPASVGGADYFKAIKGPLPQVKLTPTGGVNLTTAGAFIKAGAEFLGVGGELVSKDALATGNWKLITETAARFIDEVKRARASVKG